MKKAVFIGICVLMAVIWLFILYMALTDEYMKEKTYACRVLGKIDNQYDTFTKTTHHHRDFILVLEADGRNLSINVSPTVWATAKEGDILYFNIAPYAFDYYNATPVRWWVLAIFSPLLIFICLVISYALLIKKNN